MTIIFSIQLKFLKFGESVSVNDFNSSDIIVNGGTISNFSNPDGNISFNVIVNPNVEKIQVSIDEGAGVYLGDNTLASSIEIQLVPSVPGKSDLLSWWFDEGRGLTVTDSIGGGLGDLAGGTSWSVDASYGKSMSFQNIGDYTDLKNPVSGWDSNLYSVGFWFKRNQASFSWSNEQISNVMFSLGNDENCSMQIGTNGSSIEIFMNTFGKRTRTNIPANVKSNFWHYFSFSYDSSSGDELSVFLDGNFVGSTSVFGGARYPKF